MKTDPLFIPRDSIVGRAARYSAWGLSGKTLGILLLLLVLGSLVGSFYLNQASQTAAAGLEIVRLTREREYWRQDNADLRRQIASMESLSRIKVRAEELGFIKPEAVEYLVVQSPPLEQPGELGREPSDTAWEAAMASGPSESHEWWEELVIQFESWSNTTRWPIPTANESRAASPR
ncbi:MAG TPA: hypothetical protein VJ714_05450 [Anaerolineae bacterium]|nr:hypothetical protein [Anaerolineae bacterium]